MASFERVAGAMERKLQGCNDDNNSDDEPTSSSSDSEDRRRKRRRDATRKKSSRDAHANEDDEPAEKDRPAEIAARVLAAYQRREYNMCLQLPPVYKNALGKAVWDVSDAQVTSAYKRLAVIIHPDKNVGMDGAVDAFRALHAAYKALRNERERQEMIDRLGETAPLMPGLDASAQMFRQKQVLRQEEARNFAVRCCAPPGVDFSPSVVVVALTPVMHTRMCMRRIGCSVSADDLA